MEHTCQFYRRREVGCTLEFPERNEVTMNPSEIEFERQAQKLVDLGYPALVNLDDSGFRTELEHLREHAAAIEWPIPGRADGTPFVVVIHPDSVAPEVAMTLTSLNGLAGFTDLTPRTSDYFEPLSIASPPSKLAYLVRAVETGTEYLNVRPEDALVAITARSRSPLTISEGIAVITHFPELLRKNACFSLPGSRGSDQRVPALWISVRRPRLGWCWDRNPHTWLGAASCADRT